MKTPAEMKQILEYKRLVASKLIPVEGNRIGELVLESSQYFYSEKLDGYLCLIHKNGKTIKFYDQNGTVLNLPHLENEFPSKADGIWAGELFVCNERSYSFLVASALNSDPKKLCLGIFDFLDNQKRSIELRIKHIQQNFPSKGIVRAIEFETADNKSALVSKFNKIKEAGGEGLVVYTPSGIGYKIKPQQSIDCVVLGYAPRENKPQIRELLLGMATNSGFLVIGKVSNGFSEDSRGDWLSRLDKIKIDSVCLEVAGNGLAFTWVQPQIVIEISCQELIFENSSGFIQKSIVEIGKKGYESLQQVPAFSLIHPVFVQERIDKKVTATDCGLRQVGWITDFTAMKSVNSYYNEAATKIDRSVYVKEGKGGKAIRKFTILNLNQKEKDYPSYIIYFTDFSSGRKDPLQTELYVTYSENKARSKMNELIEDNIKKGWEKIV